MHTNMQNIRVSDIGPRTSDIKHGTLKHCHVIIIGRLFHAFHIFIPSCCYVYFSFDIVGYSYKKIFTLV